MTNMVSQDGDKYIAHFTYMLKGEICKTSYYISEEEYNRFQKVKTFPIKVLDKVGNGTKIWANKDGLIHRIDGPASISYYGTKYYYIHQKIFDEKDFRKRVYFLRKKIIILKKLIEIPEQFDEVYYAYKKDFVSLIKKI